MKEMTGRESEARIMSANESTARGYGRMEDETREGVLLLFGKAVKEVASNVRDIVECAVYEAKENAEEKKLERKNAKEEAGTGKSPLIFGSHSYKDADLSREDW